jgi:predicted transcriptional regulator
MGLVKVRLESEWLERLDALARAERRPRSVMAAMLLERQLASQVAVERLQVEMTRLEAEASVAVDTDPRGARMMKAHPFKQAPRPAPTGRCSCGEHRDAEVHGG